MRDVKREERPTDLACETCGTPMVIKWGRRGEFLACSGYPECKNTTNFTRDEDGTIQLGRGRDHRRDVRRSAASRCRSASAASASSSAAPAIPSARTCSRCIKPGADRHHVPRLRRGRDHGEALARAARSSTAATAIPECQFVAWDRPVPEPCPQCGAAVRHREDDQALRHGPPLRRGRLRLAGAARRRATAECAPLPRAAAPRRRAPRRPARGAARRDRREDGRKAPKRRRRGAQAPPARRGGGRTR